MTNYAKDFKEWAKDKYFIISELKAMFTPYEQAEKFEDEQLYEQVTDGCFIVDAIQISDNDMLIGIKDYWEQVDKKTRTYFLEISSRIQYYKLSQISLTDITSTESKEYGEWERRESGSLETDDEEE